MNAPSSKHKCPKAGCNAQVPHHMLCCRKHWYELPKPLRDAINSTWRNSEKEAHAANVRQAYELLS